VKESQNSSGEIHQPTGFTQFKGHDKKAEYLLIGNHFFFPFRSKLDSSTSECEKMFKIYLEARDEAKNKATPDEEKAIGDIFAIMLKYLAQIETLSEPITWKPVCDPKHEKEEEMSVEQDLDEHQI
jgi:hypothetical protein